MKFMEKAKRFFTLSAKHEGFTLVELIVVIAILAILAGVAVPAYSGYINKSKRASDDTLLNAVNKAFASSLSANGSDIWMIKDAKVGFDTAANSYAVLSVDGAANEKVADSFKLFFQGNEGLQFEVIEPVFDPYKAMFVARGEETGMSVPFGKGNYVIALKNIEAFKGSVFAQDVPAMQGQLTGISTAFGTFVGSVEGAGTISPEFEKFMNDKGYGDEDLGNAAVLYVAQNAGNYNAQDIADMFQNCANYMETTGDKSLGGIMNNAFDDDQDALTSAALMYGAVTAYANSDKCTDPNLKTTVANVSNGSDLVNVFMSLNGNAGWESYIGNTKVDEDGNTSVIASNQFTNDMNGFLGAMDAINTVSPGVKTDDAGFWNSDEVNGLLGSLLS